jgi:hypothetical protein
MSQPTRRGIVDKIRAGMPSLITRGEHRTQTRTAFEKYFFRLGLFQETPEGDYVDALDAFQQSALEPGRRYWLRVSSDPNPDSRSWQQDIIASYDIELKLTCLHPAIQIKEARCSVERDRISTFDHSFAITVLPDYVSSDLSFELMYRPKTSLEDHRPLSTLKLSCTDWVAGERLPARSIDIGTELAQNIRVLHVVPSVMGKVYVRSYWDKHREFEIEISKPAKSLAQFIEKPEWPQSIIGLMRSEQYDHPQLIRWVKENLQRHDQNDQRFFIIILDDADSDIAWELMPVRFGIGEKTPRPAGLGDEIPLGALAVVSRWIPGLRWGDVFQKLRVEREDLKGSVVACLDEYGLTAAAVEGEALSSFKTERWDALHSLVGRLSRPLDGVALVYLASHGTIVQDVGEETFVLSSLKPYQQIKVHSFEYLPFISDPGRRPVLMVNACHSAWLFSCGDARRGLPMVFLKRLAKGFVGTIGPVDSQYAAEIAQHILGAIRSSENGICIAEALQALRVDAVRRVQADPTKDQNWSNYLYTFMYVYYGNPCARLQLVRADEAV